MSKRTIKFVLIFGMLLAFSLIMVACSGATQVAQPTSAPAPTQATVATCPAPQPCPTAVPVEPGIKSPNEDTWAASPHNAKDSEAFKHWDTTDDKKVPVTCAQCHSTPGYVDFLGGDGSAAGKVDQPVDIGTTVTCDACHNPAANALSSVTFLSGVEIKGLGPEARCMVCHQGRATMVQVDKQIETFKATDLDAVVAPMKDGDKTTNFGFINIHYFAAAVTLYGKEVQGGYQYEGKSYDAKFGHVENFDSCVECHDPHTTELRVEKCAECHEGVASKDDLKKIRMVSSASDYDGDGNVTESIYDEFTGVQAVLLSAIQSYAKEVTGSGVVYDGATYPYFIADKDGDGKGDVDDKSAAVAFNTWTPRLLKAAYNYQISVKDPGAYAHGSKYIIELMYDSTADLNEKLASKVDMSKMAREDAGHFAGDTEAFRHWDAEEMTVPGTCAKCHAAAGLPQFIKEGANISVPASNGFLCSTCHDEANFPALYAVNEVTFPSGATVSFGEGVNANLCIVCHQGRESSVSIAKSVAGLPADTASDKIRFRNVHYFAAGATLFGSETQGIYQYPNKTYAGRFAHTQGVDNCVACHDKHALSPNLEACKGCHQTDDPSTIRMNSKADYDGDKDVTEGLKGEYEGVQAKLYTAIQDYAKAKSKGILYDPIAYPYFFLDADNDGKPDVDDKGAAIGYNAFTPKLVLAAYNYQYSVKDPGAYVHNFHYVVQAMYDSIQDLGGSVTGMTRPE
jgi:hypothetical protein